MRCSAPRVAAIGSAAVRPVRDMPVLLADRALATFGRNRWELTFFDADAWWVRRTPEMMLAGLERLRGRLATAGSCRSVCVHHVMSAGTAAPGVPAGPESWWARLRRRPCYR